MKHWIRSVAVLALLVVVAAGCQSMTGKSLGENVDDATITGQVKTKLAAEKLGTLTRVDVETDNGVVQLSGTVENESIKQRATELASEVKGVRSVVNNLQIQKAQN
jgi:hyperosmotically inducible protein